MATTSVTLPVVGPIDGDGPIVILGANGAGKTRLARELHPPGGVTTISAQRRTWLDDTIPVNLDEWLNSQMDNQENQWRSRPWHPTEEINFALSKIIQEHNNELNARNDLARSSGDPIEPVTDTKLIQLQDLWTRLFPKRKLEVTTFFPKVQSIESGDSKVEVTYSPRDMSDGERTILYMVARVMTARKAVILVDEPELHMHSRLAVAFWDEAEQLRPDCRFVYVTHDLNFALSRRQATVVLVRSKGEITRLTSVDELPASVASEVLGAATLPFYARRVCLYEGEAGKGFASEFFAAWFDGNETFAIPCGDRDSVCAAVSGLKKVGVAGAEIVGLVDRDFYADEALTAVTDGVIVLDLHEIESVLCDPDVVKAVATHLGRDPVATWTTFIDTVRKTFSGKTLSHIVAQRVRARVTDLLVGAFDASQVAASVAETREAHKSAVAALDMPEKLASLFDLEQHRVTAALGAGDKTVLRLFPGKHLLSILVSQLGMKRQEDLVTLVVRALHRRQVQEPALKALGEALEAALEQYIPPRRCAPGPQASTDQSAESAFTA